MNPPGGRTLVGRVAELRRYPVKSMQGEALQRVGIGPQGLDADRQFAVIDAETRRVASAKNPRKWAGLLDLRAELRAGVLHLTAPDGGKYRDDRDDLNAVLSRLLGRPVALRGSSVASGTIEVEWPDVPGLPSAGAESVEPLPAGGYFDLAPVHVVTTATLRHLRELAPGCDFDPRRFRPNVVIETVPGLTDFAETGWVGRAVWVGDVPLEVTGACSRCVMTTLAQPGLAADAQILRAAVAHNAAVVGVYATAPNLGEVSIGQPLWLE
ncbi:MAG: MOSC domain-containing protein [Planctomycetes bacterium]|nr:MOSC domain-containing protein [Planctomycetota bacterium]